MPPVTEFPPIVTKSRLCADLRQLGVASGQTLMLHASVKAVGRVVGGPDMVIEALLDVLGPDGTLTMMVSYEDSTYELNDWPEEWRQAYLAEAPPFDPKRSRAYRKWSILTEYLRTWPGAQRSNHPDVSFAAVGPRAVWLTADHPLNDWFGPGSPLDKLCQADGRVLILGSAIGDLTLIHHAESVARVPKELVIRYKAHMLLHGDCVGLTSRTECLLRSMDRARTTSISFRETISPRAAAPPALSAPPSLISSRQPRCVTSPSNGWSPTLVSRRGLIRLHVGTFVRLHVGWEGWRG